MKTKKVLKRIAKIEALISKVTDRSSASPSNIRVLLRHAKAAFPEDHHLQVKFNGVAVHEHDRASVEVVKRPNRDFERPGQLLRCVMERPGVEPKITMRVVHGGFVRLRFGGQAAGAGFAILHGESRIPV